MKKKVLVCLFVLIYAFSLVSVVYAGSQKSLLVDNANLLTPSEETALLATLKEISERQNVDIVILTENSLNGKTPRRYADDYYDNNGYSVDGVLLLIAMETRDVYISTSGYGINAFTDAGIEYIISSITDDLGDKDYSEAFGIYAELCDDYITQSKEGNPYDTGNMRRADYDVLKCLLISLVIGLIVALIVTGIMASQLKSVRFQSGASDYMIKDSFVLTKSRDIYLYRNVTRRERPKDNNSGGSGTHSSSSGRSHGGGGGKF